MKPETFIISAVRTPVGRYGGSLATVRPDDLAAAAIRSAVEQSKIDPERVDEVIFGNANGAGEENRNVARMATLLAGLPLHVPGVTINRLCASGMTSITFGSALIASGQADVVVVGGVESMTRAPWVTEKPSRPWVGPGKTFDTSIGWRFTNPRFLSGPESRGGKMTFSMPETAEEVARVYDISREDADAFAFESHQRALAAIAAGEFAGEIIPIATPDGKVVAQDEGPRPDTTLERLATLRPVVAGGSVVTAGNASSLNDGASALVLASASAVDQMGLEPLAVVLGGAAVGLEPETMGMGPVPATRKLLEQLSLQADAFSSFELNEAFATQSLASIRELRLDPALVNPAGGAIALGHPLGSSGSRLAVTLAHRLAKESSGSRGLATMCVGVGQGTALALKGL